jgi:cyanophycinase
MLPRETILRRVGKPKDKVRVVLVTLGWAKACKEQTQAEGAKEYWKDAGVDDNKVYTLNAALLKASPEKAKELLRDADVIWFLGGDQWLMMERLASAHLEAPIRDRFRAGGFVGGTSAGAVIAAQHIFDTRKNATSLGAGRIPVSEGLGLLEDAIIDTHFLERLRLTRLTAAVLDDPRQLGIGIEAGTCIAVAGRELEVLGSGPVLILDGRRATKWHKDAYGPLAGANLDLHILQRGMRFDLRTRTVHLPADGATGDGKARADVIDPRDKKREKAKGRLVLHGGGIGLWDTWKGVVDHLEDAGITDPRVVILALGWSSPNLEKRQGREARRLWEAAEADRSDINVLYSACVEKSKEEAIDLVREAHVICLLGEDESLLMNRLISADLSKVILERYRAGAIVVGTSAGAATAATRLIDSEKGESSLELGVPPLTKGLDMIPQTIIETHFLEGLRFARLTGAILNDAQSLGIGIDEGAGIVVEGDELEVVGSGSVVLFDGRRSAQMPPLKGGPAFGTLRIHVLRAGMRFDLARRVLLPARSCHPDR